ncbi:hypothetical protein ACFL1R_09875 [Candidatus Latescibacterota bacterium]
MLHKVLMLCIFILVSLFAVAFTQGEAPSIQMEASQFGRRKAPDIDMFMGSWEDSAPRQLLGSLTVWDILTKCDGDPLRPGKKGAVLTDINSVSYAVLKAQTSTTSSTLNNVQFIFYIISGDGIIKAGAKTADLHEGIGVIMAPGIEFTMTNNGNEQLTMYIIEEPIPDGFVPNKLMVVKDEYDNIISTNIHRVDSTNWLFSMNDGLSTLTVINPIMYEPRSLVPPHMHPAGIEEVWIAIRDEIIIQVGLKRRRLPVGSAYKVPADGFTPHTNINKTDVSKKLMWMMKVPVSETPTRKTQPEIKNMI